MNIERRYFSDASSGGWRKSIAIGLLVSAVGCTTSPRLSSIDAGLVTVPVEFQDYSGHPTDKGPRDSKLRLGAISGQMNGTTNIEIKTIGIGSSATLAVPMTEIEGFSAKRASALTSAAAAAGFTLVPSDARLLRVATVLLSADPHWHSAATSLTDSSSKKTLLLVYFDRPCRLSGAVIAHPSSGGTRTDHYDVVIDKAGLNWLEMTKVGEDSHWEVRHAPESVQPVVIVRAKQQSG